MGILKAFTAAAAGAARDQWKECFYCNALNDNTMMVRGRKMNGSGNNNGDNNVITDGSTYIVNEGQAAVVVSQGKVIEECLEPGEHVFNAEATKGVFSKGGLSNTLKDIGNRVSYGGDVPITQRIYYINTKLLPGGAFNRLTIPFRFVDNKTGLDMDVTVVCSGMYTFRVEKPGLFYKLIAGNVSGDYGTESVKRIMNAEYASILKNAFAALTSEGKRSYEIATMAETLEPEIREKCSEKWLELRGLKMMSLAFTEFDVIGSDRNIISSTQRDRIYTDPTMAAASIVTSTADAVVLAAKNEAPGKTVMVGFTPGNITNESSMNANASAEWVCTCGNRETMNFCRQCGAKRP